MTTFRLLEKFRKIGGEARLVNGQLQARRLGKKGRELKINAEWLQLLKTHREAIRLWLAEAEASKAWEQKGTGWSKGYRSQIVDIPIPPGRVKATWWGRQDCWEFMANPPRERRLPTPLDVDDTSTPDSTPDSRRGVSGVSGQRLLRRQSNNTPGLSGTEALPLPPLPTPPTLSVVTGAGGPR
jgi:hypothetical protein